MMAPVVVTRARRNIAAAMAGTLALSLALAGCFEGGGLPSLAVLQATYDSAKLESKETHDDQLLIRQAACHKLGSDKVTCQVAFTDERSASGRLFYDVIGLDREGRGWRLVSGLCRR